MWDSVHSCLIVHSWDVFMDRQSRNRTQEDMCSRHIVVCGKDTDNFRKCSSPQLHGPQFSMKTLCLKRKRDRSKLIICIYCIYMYIYKRFNNEFIDLAVFFIWHVNEWSTVCYHCKMTCFQKLQFLDLLCQPQGDPSVLLWCWASCAPSIEKS